MRYAIAIPQFHGDGTFDPDAFRDYLVRAEQAGYHSAWTQEQVLGTHPQLSPLETMTFAAACTDTLRLGCTVFVSTLHVPAHLAKAISSLDQLSRGRVEVGVGSGGKQRPWAAFGMTGDRYFARFIEGVELMKAFWTQDRVTHEGEFWQVANAGMEPKPFQKPHPPLWFGGSGPTALRRAVSHGNGFFGAGSTPTAKFVDQVRTVRTELAAAGRDTDPETFPIAKRVYIAIDNDGGRARERINAELGSLYGYLPASIEAAAIAGTVDDCVRALREIIAGGAELILFTPMYDQAEHAERIATDIIPKLA